MIIYKITNLINDKIYIGQTIRSLNTRWKQHLKKTNKCTVLKNAIQKYGKENFKIETVCYCDNINQMNHREFKIINLFNSLSPNGYNLMSGGGNSKHSQETKNKLSVINKNKKLSKETKNKISISLKKHVKSQKHKEKLSISLKKHVKSQKHKEKIKLNSISYWSNNNNKNNMSIKKGGEEFHVFKVIKWQGMPKRSCFLPLENKYIGTWTNQNQCARDLDLSSKCLNTCLKKEKGFHKMYFFSKDKICNQ